MNTQPADSIQARLNAVRAHIASAEHQYGRAPGSVTLLAVSKTWPVADILAAVDAGQACFGESYLQEAVPKIEALAGKGIEWHFIGPIQSNKTKPIALHFDWVHSIDRLSVAQRLNDQRPPELPPLHACLQVNIGNEPQKAGVGLAELPALADAVAVLPRLRLRGLMAIPPLTDNFNTQRQIFRRVREALERLNARGLNLDTLSMGMSGDLEAAIAEGATMVRIGSAIFGSRAPLKIR
ncbi:MAG: YggS family pyridoxal phosphate-dependent enzyme [Gammaproteobacteria bacterium]|nr:YggS family pyridoxal phosphate-dependent enzyme [Gammaproteobacteria bacterium]